MTEADAALKATKTGKPVEATALRSAYTTTWAQPDGSLLRRMHSSPVRAKVDGVWKAIDPTLERVERGWAPKATNTAMVFSAGSKSGGKPDTKDGSGTRPERASRASARIPLLPPVVVPSKPAYVLATITIDGHEIKLTWPSAIPEPIVDGSRALYPEILPGADLVLTADDNGFAQLLVVKTRAAAADPRIARLAYGLSSFDLGFSLDPVSGIISARDQGGQDIAESPTPLMWDSAGAPATTDGQTGTDVTAPPEVLPSDSGSTPPEPDDTETPTAEPTDAIRDGDVEDPFDEVLPEATDEAPDPSNTEPGTTVPPVPAEPTPEPTQTGPAATLSLPSLNGPQPASHGALVETHLDEDDWILSPDQDFLADESTVYPVFIDPSVSKHTNDWTTAYSRHPYANFYNGKNFNKGGTHEARVGFESDTWGTSRSFFTIDWEPDIKGALVTKAVLRTLNTYSWSCQARSMSVHLTGTISSKTNWKNAPAMNDGNRIGRGSFAHGYKSNCRDDYESFDIKPTAQRAVANGWSTITIGFRATDENSQYSWKKFQANGGSDPYIDLTYNRPPNAPTGLDLDPDLSCDTTYPYVNLGASSLALWASASDKDGNLASVNFELWLSSGGPNLLGSKGKVSVGSQYASARVHTDPIQTGATGLKLVNGQTYSWRAKTIDKNGSASGYSHTTVPCRFVFDTVAPTAPIVTSPHFPDADARDNGFNNDAEDSLWSSVKFGTAGTFVFRAGQTDVIRYEYGFNQGNYPFSVSRAAGAAVSTLTSVTNVKPPMAGPNVLYVRAVDDAGHVSPPTKYFFYLTPRDKADEPGDFTGDDIPDMFIVDGNGNLRLYPGEARSDDLSKGNGDIGYSMSGAYRGNPLKDPSGDSLPVYAAPPSGYWKDTLITHLGDVYGGDGLQDLIARREGRLWVYPGDGYGAVNVDKRQQILLPANAPNPANYSQIVAVGDATGDGKTDFFLTTGSELWALTGYNGATVESATRLAASGWADYDIVSVQDVNGDRVTDLLYRNDPAGKLYLRLGKPGASGGVDFASLGSAAASASPGGVDVLYGAGGWQSTNVRLLLGTPDVNGDNIPDVWTIRVDGGVRFYAGTTGEMRHAGVTIVANTDGVGWKNKLAIG